MPGDGSIASGLVEKNPSTGATKTYYRFGGKLVAERDASGLHYLHQDHLGSTSLQTSATGATEGAEFRGPFGQPWTTTGSQATDLRYTGQRSLEADLGSLFHYQARWYSPVLGRFTQPDTIVPNPGDPQHLNRYSYVANNPLRYTDPTGHVTSTTPTGPPPTRTHTDKADGSVWDGSWVWRDWGWTFIDGKMLKGSKKSGGSLTQAGLEFLQEFWENLTQGMCFDTDNPLVCPTVVRDANGIPLLLPIKDFSDFGPDDVAEAGGRVARGASGGGGGASARGIRVSQRGFDIVRNHLGQFGPAKENDVMLRRLREALEENRPISGADANFYLHELTESTYMRNGLSYDDAHKKALDKHGASPYSIYHPEAIRANPEVFNDKWFDYWGMSR